MLQFGPQRHSTPPKGGVEGWLPPLVLAVTRIALVIALSYFALVAYSMRGRIALPRPTVPLVIAAAGLLALYMLFQAFGQLRQVWRALSSNTPSESDRR